MKTPEEWEEALKKWYPETHVIWELLRDYKAFRESVAPILTIPIPYDCYE